MPLSSRRPKGFAFVSPFMSNVGYAVVVRGAGDFWYSSMSPHRVPPAAPRSSSNDKR
jgi:hypothetical protein